MLKPWHELEPDAVLLDAGPVEELLAGLDDTGVVLREDLQLTLP